MRPAFAFDEQAIAALRTCPPSGKELTRLLIFLKVGWTTLDACQGRAERHTSKWWLLMTVGHRSSRPSRPGLNRRRLLQRTAAIGAVLPFVTKLGLSPARAQKKTINVASFGGVIQDYQTRLFARPFEAKTGIKVNIGPNASLALAKLQNSSGAPAQWDIISLSGAEYFEAVSQNLIAPYDYTIIDPTHIPPEYRESHGVKFALSVRDGMGQATDP